MSSGKMKGGTILNPVTSVMRAGYAMMSESHLNSVGHDQRLMDYVKSGDRELGVVIEHRECVGNEL